MSAGLHATFTRRFAAGPELSVESLQTAGPGLVTVLFGASGAGKTTVLRCVAGLERPESGSISFGRETWFSATEGLDVPPRRRRIGFVSQDYSLFPHLTVRENIAYAAPAPGRVRELIAWLGLAGLERRLPRELSGGEKQRVALARAVARHPALLLLDEPLAALDAPTRNRVRGELRHWLRQLGIPTLLVTHDRAEALELGDTLALLHSGRIAQQGPPHEVFSRPASLEIAELVGMETVEPACVESFSDGLAQLTLGAVRLTSLAPELPAACKQVYACIRAEDVILVREAVVPSSPRNRLRGRVNQVQRQGPMMRIELDCGFPLKALLTPQACEELFVREGESFFAMVKVSQIHLIPRPI